MKGLKIFGLLLGAALCTSATSQGQEGQNACLLNNGLIVRAVEWNEIDNTASFLDFKNETHQGIVKYTRPHDESKKITLWFDFEEQFLNLDIMQVVVFGVDGVDNAIGAGGRRIDGDFVMDIMLGLSEMECNQHI